MFRYTDVISKLDYQIQDVPYKKSCVIFCFVYDKVHLELYRKQLPEMFEQFDMLRDEGLVVKDSMYFFDSVDGYRHGEICTMTTTIKRSRALYNRVVYFLKNNPHQEIVIPVCKCLKDKIFDKYIDMKSISITLLRCDHD